MSLLMDALKKAEQEKKEAAKRLKNAESHSGDQLELAEDDFVESKKSSEEAPAEPPAKTTEAGNVTESAEPLSLETPENAEEDNAPVEYETPEPHMEVQGEIEDITIEHPDISVPELSLSEYVEEDNTQEIKPTITDPAIATANFEIEDSSDNAVSVENTVKQPEPEEFYDTLTENRTITSVVSAAELAKDIGGGKDQPTPVAAQTVFTAVSTGSETEGYKWVVFLVLCTMVVASLSVIYYFEIVPSHTGTSSPFVANEINVDPATLPTVDIPEEVIQGAIISKTGGDDAALDYETVTDTDQLEVDEPAQQTTSQIAAVEPSISDLPVTKEITATTPHVDPVDIEISNQDKVEEEAVPDRSSVADIKSQTLPTYIEVEPVAIKISRSKAIEDNKTLINDAYEKYKSGDYSNAKIAYQKVLDSMPENRDALLGLGSIAYISGDVQNAYNYYRKVLKLYPQDNIARSALINMQSGRNAVQSESVIKSMIIKEPEVSFLHFVLGNIYASQSRWPDAQQAFFDAYRFESNNPDYAYNLAVSLDRLGQTKTALDYYNVALQLADTGIVNFNTSKLLERIKTISASSQLTN